MKTKVAPSPLVVGGASKTFRGERHSAARSSDARGDLTFRSVQALRNARFASPTSPCGRSCRGLPCGAAAASPFRHVTLAREERHAGARPQSRARGHPLDHCVVREFACPRRGVRFQRSSELVARPALWVFAGQHAVRGLRSRPGARGPPRRVHRADEPSWTRCGHPIAARRPAHGTRSRRRRPRQPALCGPREGKRRAPRGQGAGEGTREGTRGAGGPVSRESQVRSDHVALRVALGSRRRRGEGEASG